MYTILVSDKNELVTTVKERIIQRSKLVDNLHFLIDPLYKTLDMTKFTAVLEYVLPVSRELRTEFLTRSDELYKGMIEYTVPIDTSLTREAGEVEMQITFTYVEMDASGNTTQYVRKTTPTTMTIIPVPAWCDVVADNALAALDQRLIQMGAMINAINDMTQVLSDTKADNITRDETGKYIQLTANGQPIGNKIELNVSVDEPSNCIKFIKIDDEGSLVVTYSDGTIENLGKIVGDVVSGIYIPDVSEDGIMTMTLSKDIGEDKYSWDINPFNDWNPIEGVEGSSNYMWEKI